MKAEEKKCKEGREGGRCREGREGRIEDFKVLREGEISKKVGSISIRKGG